MALRVVLSIDGRFALQSYAICALAMLSACSPTRRLGEGERFLERVEVTAPDGTKHANEGAFEEVLRQQPNTRLFGIRLPLQIHLMVRPEALENAQQKLSLIHI